MPLTGTYLERQIFHYQPNFGCRVTSHSSRTSSPLRIDESRTRLPHLTATNHSAECAAVVTCWSTLPKRCWLRLTAY